MRWILPILVRILCRRRSHRHKWQVIDSWPDDINFFSADHDLGFISTIETGRKLRVCACGAVEALVEEWGGEADDDAFYRRGWTPVKFEGRKMRQ